MALINAFSQTEFRQPFDGYWIGEVVDNKDPERLGRIKVKIKGLFPLDCPTEALPWIAPLMPAMFGSSSYAGSLCVPDVGSKVVVSFINDVYSGFYIASLIQKDAVPNELLVDYPNSYGFRDKNGNRFIINKATNHIVIQQASSARFEILPDSEVRILSGKAVVIGSMDGKTRFVFDTEKGEFDIKAREKQTYSGAALEIKNKEVVYDVAYEKKFVKGASETKISGGKSLTIGGSYSRSIVGNYATSIAGNESHIIAGKTKRTFGLDITEDLVLGDYSTEIKKGNRKYKLLLGNFEKTLVAGNHEISILLGSMTHDLKKGDVKYNLLLGDFKRDLTAGNIEDTIKKGDKKTKINIGDYSINIDAGDYNLKILKGDTSISITTGNFEVKLTAGDVTLATPMAKLEMTKSGDITIKSVLASAKITAAGEIVLSDGTIAKLKLARGQVGLGTPACEIVDMLIKIIDVFLNQPSLCMTGTGPSGPLLPPATVQLAAYKALLTAIKGGV